MRYSLGDRSLQIKGPDFFIADSADLIGSVVIENNVSIWYNTVLRGDIGTLIIGEGSNIQDGSVLHTDLDGEVLIGKNVVVGHMVVLHDCTIGDNCLIGMGAIILSKAKVGKNCIIGAGALITEGKEIPDNSVVLGSPGKIIREVTEKDIENTRILAERYVQNFKRYKKELRPE